MECFVQHAVDYKGMPADRTETGGWLSAALIAGMHHTFIKLPFFFFFFPFNYEYNDEV